MTTIVPTMLTMVGIMSVVIMAVAPVVMVVGGAGAAVLEVVIGMRAVVVTASKERHS